MKHKLSGKRVLLLGDTGKLGQSLITTLPADIELIRHNSRTFDAGDFDQVRQIISESCPDVVFNTVAFMGIDACEKEPEKAFRINTLLPKLLAEKSRESRFTLIHFSTESVFDDTSPDQCYSEKDAASPINVYGMSKYGGDCFVKALATDYYIFRIALLFGPSGQARQFVERMVANIRAGATMIRVADDIFITPSYSVDVASKAVQLLEEGAPYGLYHLTNSGTTTLYTLLKEIITTLGLEVTLEKGSHNDFPSLGRKNSCTPLRSGKIAPLRTWQESVADYCRLLAADRRN